MEQWKCIHRLIWGINFRYFIQKLCILSIMKLLNVCSMRYSQYFRYCLAAAKAVLLLLCWDGTVLQTEANHVTPLLSQSAEGCAAQMHSDAQWYRVMQRDATKHLSLLASGRQNWRRAWGPVSQEICDGQVMTIFDVTRMNVEVSNFVKHQTFLVHLLSPNETRSGWSQSQQYPRSN